ncbi:VOC family protein [Pseudomonas chlororaphis]|uniref:Lactoylglutathione lyase n=1 Tax=Pseudomonas chlororaphis TaxID=587753 RepID=A0A0D5XZ99_9PSED|nr:VOC family protein [Pseudomonas chlororaphis]AKA24391.1 lactoylglutathione lyase [Pseudomonas chlororaphis]
MFSHIQIGARDLPRLVAFYDAVLAPLGLVRESFRLEDGLEAACWRFPGQHWPQFIVQPPINGLPANWGNGVQVSFAARSPDHVRQAWAVAISLGALDEGVPGFRPRYSEDYFGAYCRDPEGNKLCFVHTAEVQALALDSGAQPAAATPADPQNAS